MRMVELCMILGFGGALLFSFRKTKRFFLLFFGTLGILLLFFLIFRADFFRQFSSAPGERWKIRLKTVYNFSLFPGYSDSIKDKLVLLIFFLIFYLLMTLFVMLWKNTILFVLLLGFPFFCSYLLEIPVPAILFFLPVEAFILWKGALYPKTISRFWLLVLPAQGLLFLAAAYLFTPMIAPQVFSVQRGLIFLCQYDRKQDFIWK